MGTSKPVKLAVVGAGIFARDAYIPIIRKVEGLELVAIWSRSEQSARALRGHASILFPGVVAYHGDDGLHELLEREDVEAVAVVLPVQVMLEVVKKCLAKGKHVLQEKPIAASTQTAVEQVAQYRQSPGNLIWMLAENYRFETAFHQLCKVAHDTVGQVISISMVGELPITEQNKYYPSAWRRDEAMAPGGYILDCGVHFVAGIRLIARLLSLGEVDLVSASSCHVNPGLPKPDTMVGWMQTTGGVRVSFIWSFSGPKVHVSMRVTGRNGVVEVLRGGRNGPLGEYLLLQDGGVGSTGSPPNPVRVPLDGVEVELHQLAAQVVAHRGGVGALSTDGHLAALGAPEEGLQDLATVQALLRSTESGRAEPVPRQY